MRIRFVILILAVASSAAVAADRRSQNPGNQPNQQQAAPDKRGTEESPLIVKTRPPDKSSEEIKQDNDKAELDRTLTNFTEDLAFYTKCLFIVTGGLALATGALVAVGFWQILDNKRAIQAAQTSADAAMLHVRAAVAVESAEILVQGINLVKFPDPSPGLPDRIIEGGPLPEYSQIVLSVFNTGRTRGEIVRISLQWGVFIDDPADNPA
jgi:hypothetical protein